MRQRSEQSIAIAVLLALVGVLYFGSSGCATWQETAKVSLDTVYVAAKGTEGAARATFDSKCKAVAYSCAAAKDSICEPLVECQEERRGIIDVVIKVYAGVAAGYSALALEQEGLSKAALSKVLLLLVDLNTLAKKAGLL